MSSGELEARSAVPAEWARLERAVRRLAEETERWRTRAHAAEARIAELEATLHDVTTGTVDPLDLAHRLELAQRESRELRERIETAAQAARRVRARLEFLEAQQ